MDDAFGMGGFESVGNLDTDVEEALKFEWAAKEQLFECLPFQVLHNNEGPSVIFANFVDGADIWMVDRKSTRLNSSHGYISYAVFCLKKKKIDTSTVDCRTDPDPSHSMRLHQP